MARYAALVGKRIQVQYRAGDIYLPATGRLVADSGKSIFLEEHFESRGRVQSFRWEIPYPCIVEIGEAPLPQEAARVADPTPEHRSPLADADLLALKKRSQET
ncbi:MAG: hypothetical protein K6U02_05735 [Firmicutes bacterium]|nr:hypothetical protein [Bacillota bacterium]